ncbi:MAG TPA: MBL fold metallo-hydrolase [Vicinamibacterales bacterium]
MVLGTGDPAADPERSGPAVAVVVNNRAYLVDCGPGVVRRSAAAEKNGIPALKARELNIVFITHLHSDHTLGHPDLVFSPWVLGRRAPFEAYGPQGLKAMTEHVEAAVPGRGGSSERRPRCLIAGVPLTAAAETPFMRPMRRLLVAGLLSASLAAPALAQEPTPLAWSPANRHLADVASTALVIGQITADTVVNLRADDRRHALGCEALRLGVAVGVAEITCSSSIGRGRMAPTSGASTASTPRSPRHRPGGTSRSGCCR